MLIPATVIAATTYEVSTSGSDTNTGKAGSPLRTIQKAANLVAPGDTVLVDPGTYNERISITRSGSAAAPIVFKSANPSGQPVVIDGTGTAGSNFTAVVNITDASYLQFMGLTVRNSPNWGVHISGSATHIELNTLDVSGCNQNGVFIETSTTAPNFTIVHNSKVHDNQAGGIAVWVAPGGYFLIENNQVYNNAGTNNYDGIQIGGGDGASHHVVARNNTSYGNGGANGADQIDFGGHAFGHHYLAENNDVSGPGGSMKVQQGFGGYAIIARRNRLSGMGLITYEFPNPAVWYNNTIVNAGHAIQFWTDSASSPPGQSFGGLEIRNNLILQSTDYLFLLNGVSGFNIDHRYSSIRLANNMYKFTSKGILWGPIFDCQLTDPSGSSAFAAYQAANSPDLQDVGSRKTTAALTAIFVDPTAHDYHLAAGSPAIDAGAPLTKTTNAGTNATVVNLVRSDYFQDGYSGLVAPDKVQVGKNAPVAVTAVDENGKTITLATPLTWSVGDPVSLPWNGAAPDIGAYESGTDLPSPTLLSVEPVL
ncbi:MAG TPA: DUF1565 domain-containing protein [Candidatus Binatia bacterium]